MNPDELHPAFLADEHVSRMVIRGRQREGVDIVAVADVGRRGLSDESHVQWAIANARVIVTCDDDYLALARRYPEAGIAYSKMHKYAPSAHMHVVRELWLRETVQSALGKVHFL